MIRPTYVIGPHDYTHRFGYWVDRIADGGQVLAPGPRERPLQGHRRPRPGDMDDRDARTWRRRRLPHRPPSPALHVRVAPADDRRHGRSSGNRIGLGRSGFPHRARVDGNDLPLWDADDTGMGCDPARAAAAGLEPRELALSIADTLDESRTAGPTSTSDQATLTREREAELVAQWAFAADFRPPRPAVRSGSRLLSWHRRRRVP